MALNIKDRYGNRAADPSLDYPTGSMRNKTSPDARDGTPLERDWANDFLGARDAILKAASIVADGEPETAGKSQVLDALTKLYVTRESLVPQVKGRLINVRIFTASGPAQYSPSAGAKTVVVEVQGGGGGGGGAAQTSTGQVSAGSGGQAGTYAKGRFTVDGTISVTVGAGGAGGVAGVSPGGGGGSSSFGSLISCPGGIGGAGGGANTASNSFGSASTASALPSGDTILYVLGQGGGGPSVFSTGQAISGSGGQSFFGVGAEARQGGEGYDSKNKGSGGSGAAVGQLSGRSYIGGRGSSGTVIVWEYT